MVDLDLTALRQDLADLLDSTSVHGLAYVPDSVTVVTACVRPGNPYVDFHAQFDAANVNLEVLLLVPKDLDFNWQEKIDDLLSSGEIVAAIEADPRFQVNGAQGWGTTVVNDIERGSVVIPVSVFL